MYFIDTHTHLFAGEFDHDRESVISAAVESGVQKMILPGIDSHSHFQLMEVVRKYPLHCFPTVGLHPTSVNDNPKFKQELALVKQLLHDKEIRFVGVGEIGLDLYWSNDFLSEQEFALRAQLDMAVEFNLPVILHTREAFPEMFAVLDDYKNSGLKGVFHGFNSTVEDYLRIKEMGGFLIGVGGVVTYKNAPLAETIKQMEVTDMLLETDAPYLTPVPYRGKRNQSSYVPLIAEYIATLKNVSLKELALATTTNAELMFRI